MSIYLHSTSRRIINDRLVSEGDELRLRNPVGTRDKCIASGQIHLNGLITPFFNSTKFELKNQTFRLNEYLIHIKKTESIESFISRMIKKYFGYLKTQTVVKVIIRSEMWLGQTSLVYTGTCRLYSHPQYLILVTYNSKFYF